MRLACATSAVAMALAVPAIAAPPARAPTAQEYRIADTAGYCLNPYTLRIPSGTRFMVGQKTEVWQPTYIRVELPDGSVEYRAESGWGTPEPHRENRQRRLMRWDHGKVYRYRPPSGSLFSMVYLPNQGWGQEWVEIRILPKAGTIGENNRPDASQLEHRWRAALDLIAPFDRCPIA